MNDREQLAALGAHMASRRKDGIDERLLLQATPALLDGWCGPVVLPDVEMHGAIVTHGMSYAYVWSDGGICRYEPADLYLDLSRAECRDRVARVVAVSAGLRHEVRDWAWYPVGSLGSHYDVTGGPDVPHPAMPEARFHSAVTRGWKPGDMVRRVIPALAGIDPNDATRLPDGSRLVDALALAIVARTVLR